MKRHVRESWDSLRLGEGGRGGAKSFLALALQGEGCAGPLCSRVLVLAMPACKPGPRKLRAAR